MSRIRSLSLLLAATALVAACSAPTAPEPSSAPSIEAPSFNEDSTADTTGITGYQAGHG